MRASLENGGVLISACNQTSGFSGGAATAVTYVRSDMPASEIRTSSWPGGVLCRSVEVSTSRLISPSPARLLSVGEGRGEGHLARERGAGPGTPTSFGFIPRRVYSPGR